MNTAVATEAWSAVVAAEPSGFDRVAVTELLSAIAVVRSVCDAAEIRAVRRARELAAAGRAEPPESILTSAVGASSRQSRTTAARERACASMQPIEAALAAGSISAGHVDAAATVHGRLRGDVGERFAEQAEDLVRRASAVSVDEFERECRDLARSLQSQTDENAAVAELDRQRAASTVKRWVDRSNGMHMTVLGLDPLRDSQMWKAVNAEVARLRQQQHDSAGARLPFAALQASAFVAAVTAGTDAPSAEPATSGGSSRTTARVPEISVLIDFDTLTDRAARAGLVCETEDGTPLPVSTVRRLCCDAHVIPIVLDTHGVVLDQGRRFRTATGEQRNALASMHRSCAFPGCTVDFSSCRIHHVRWWWKHLGRTDLANLVPLCEEHHHLVHEGGWELAMTPDRLATWTRPDGTIHRSAMVLDRRPRDVPLRT